MNGPSEHLSWEELGCNDGTPYPEKWRQDRAKTLAGAFETIRERAGGKPITVTSAYRTPTYNRRIGGAANSQHVQGRAMDLKPPSGLNVEQFFRLIKNVAREEGSPIKGIGRYPTFIHVDIRPTPELVVFYKSKSVNNEKPKAA